MARGTKSGLAKKVNVGMYDTIAFSAETGEPVRVRVPVNTSQDHTIPQANDEGVIPEFVNVGGTVFQVCPPVGTIGETIIVPPFGILKGEQHRDKSEPSKAWGIFPPFKERTDVDGKFDPEYLFTEKEVIEEVTNITSPEMGRKRLHMWAAYGKVQSFDDKGMPMKSQKELEEDRPKAHSFILGRAGELQVRWDTIWAQMTGTRTRKSILPGSPAS